MFCPTRVLRHHFSIVSAWVVEYNFDMVKTITRTILLSTLLLAILSSGQTAAQSGAGELYIPETGHWIRGEVLNTYQSASDPLLLFGYPITDEIIDPIDGQHTQYFEKARFDLTKSSSGTIVEIAPLGQLLYTPGNEPVSLASTHQACRTFSASGKTVCYAFLDFYDQHNGEYFFGNPISQVEYAEGRYVQYFENCRMEWRPELPSGKRVALTNLGKLYFNSRLGDRTILNPDNGSSTPGELVELQTHAFVASSLLPANSHQELFITVQDQNLNPISGAMVNVKIIQPDGNVEVYRPQMTDADGISTLKFKVGDLPINDVIRAEIQVQYKGFQANAATWFRIWW